MRKLALFVVFAWATVAAGGDDVIRIEPKPGGWEVMEMLSTITEYTGQSVLFDSSNPQIRSRKIEWTGTVELPREKVFRWFRATLYQQRLLLVPTGPREAHQWVVVDANDPNASTHPEYVPAEDLPAWADADGVYITTTITCEHIDDTSRARNAIAQMCSRPLGRVNDIPGARAIVIADFAPVVCAMYENLMKLDRESADAPPLPAGPVRGGGAVDERQRLEKCLMGSTTEAAAQYFIAELRALDAKK